MNSEHPDNLATASGGKGRRQSTIILAIALLTLGGSYLLFYFASTGASWGTTNHGSFVTPPTTMQALGWPSDMERSWRLWVVADESCNAACGQKVKDMRALHILLSKEAGRVRRALTVHGTDSTAVTLAEAFPKLERVNLMPGASSSSPMPAGVYIIDPNGNLVFHYQMADDPKWILTDLKKLLKLSQIG